jgi:hypothetical protein
MISDKRIKSLIQNAIIDITQIVKDEKYNYTNKVNKNKKQLCGQFKNINNENISQDDSFIIQQSQVKSYFESMNKINDCLDKLTETE